MLILHDDSFNIDYTLNCPPNKNISKIRNIIFGDLIDFFLKRNIQVFFIYKMEVGIIQILNHQKIYSKNSQIMLITLNLN